jgi:hypothetical protein
LLAAHKVVDVAREEEDNLG